MLAVRVLRGVAVSQQQVVAQTPADLTRKTKTTAADRAVLCGAQRIVEKKAFFVGNDPSDAIVTSQLQSLTLQKLGLSGDAQRQLFFVKRKSHAAHGFERQVRLPIQHLGTPLQGFEAQEVQVLKLDQIVGIWRHRHKKVSLVLGVQQDANHYGLCLPGASKGVAGLSRPGHHRGSANATKQGAGDTELAHLWS